MATALACAQPTPCAAVLRCCLRALVLGAAALSAVPADAQSFSAGGFTFTTPHGWQRQTVSSSMRAAQFRIPGDASGDGALAIFYLFRAGAGGGAEANIARWKAAFVEPPDALGAIVERHRGRRGPVHLFAAIGTLRASAELLPGYGLLAAMLEGGPATVFIRLAAPAAVIGRERAGFRRMALDAAAAR